MKKQDFNLYQYLRSQFNDLESAKEFMWQWANEIDKGIPGFPLISSRALSAHVSAILEGKTEYDTDNEICTNYLATKYGSELYNAAWSSKPNNK